VKIHRVLAEGCVAVLDAVFAQGKVLDRALEAAFSANPRWGKRDRGFIAETVFEVVRWRRALAFVADGDSPAALCVAQWRRMGLEIPEWWAWTGCDVEEMAVREGELSQQPRAIRESVPDWLDARGESELGERWDAELAALNRKAGIFLRANRLAGTREETAAWLAGEGIETRAVEGVPDALEVTRGRIGKPLLASGRFEIQDASSQRVAPLLGVEPGMRVIDACAGAGGKTLQLAAAMQNRGEIIALDVAGRKLGELQNRAKRAGVSIIRTEIWSEQTLRQLAGWADAVLIDAPCSGLGTLKRQPDLKWRLTEPSLEKTRRLQRRLLDHYPEVVAAGGRFVYATCSVLPSENEGQVAALLERDPRWQLERQETFSPAVTGHDGLFGARLVRK
jgi:16S rRNA (cytosine967-C5)-methyltransferase